MGRGGIGWDIMGRGGIGWDSGLRYNEVVVYAHLAESWHSVSHVWIPVHITGERVVEKHVVDLPDGVVPPDSGLGQPAGKRCYLGGGVAVEREARVQ